MCRLFAQITPEPRAAAEFLSESTRCLLRQSDADPFNPQRDGWGVAWFGNSGEARVSKSPKAVFEDTARFTSAARAARSRVVLGHLRAASNPRGVPRARLINLANTQPFTSGDWVFAHNGTLEIPQEIVKRLGPLAARVRSLNDSEVYFWQFMKFLRATGDPAQAFISCARENWSVWKECRARYPGKAGPYTSLNAVASDGRRLAAFCHSARRGLARFGACSPAQPWQLMCMARRGGGLVIASENLDEGRWERLEPPEAVCAQARDGRLSVTRTRFKSPQP